MPVDTILVISHEKLSIDLTRLFPQLTILRLPKSGGAVDLDEHYNAIIQAFQIRSYFYGEPRIPTSLSSLPGRMVGVAGQLTPYSFQIGWETLTVVRVGEGKAIRSCRYSESVAKLGIENAAPSSALPLGSSRVLSPTRLTRVDPSGPAHVHRLMNAVLAIVHIIPGDRIVKDKEDKAGTDAVADIPVLKSEAKDEGPDGAADAGTKAAVEGGTDQVIKPEDGEQGDEEVKPEVDDDEDDDEVPYIEDVGTREVAGFIVMLVSLKAVIEYHC